MLAPDTNEPSAPGAAANAPPAAPATETSPTPKPTSTVTGEDEVAPAKPPRPPTEAQKNFLILKEAFPSVDDGVIKAVLSASGGNVERAFNALLGKPRCHQGAVYAVP